MKKKWYAIYTKQYCERKASLLLSKKNIINYLPLNRVIKELASQKNRHTLEPLFPNMLFVNIESSQFETIQKTEEVINFFYWLGRKAIINDNEIMDIQRFIHDYSNIKVEKAPVSLNRMLGINNIDNHKESIYIKNNRVTTILKTIGYSISAEVNISASDIVKYEINIKEMNIN